jgi:hypothetical protein
VNAAKMGRDPDWFPETDPYKFEPVSRAGNHRGGRVVWCGRAGADVLSAGRRC